MACLHYLNSFVCALINDIRYIYLPTSLALVALYLPILFLSLSKHLLARISKWRITILLITYLLVLPCCPFVRVIPIFNAGIAVIAIYYAEKVCEWILIRRTEFEQWSFLDIQHELFYYRVYTQAVSVRKLNQKTKKIFFIGPVQYNRRLKSLIHLSWNINKYYLLLDLTLYSTYQVFSTDLYDEYYQQFLLVRVIVNLSIGCLVYLWAMMNYEILRFGLCLFFNRPLELIPDLFQQPYRATSPVDFWARWHQVFKNTWTELIFKPTSRFILNYWPHSPKIITYGISSLSVFLFSGIVHEYIAYVTLNDFSGAQIKFFLLQGFAVLIEHAFKYRFAHLTIPQLAGILFTFLFNGLTAGYFLQPWIPYLAQKQILKYSLIDFIMRNVFDKD